MAIYYKGAPIGHYLHAHDPRSFGLGAVASRVPMHIGILLQHIARGTTTSPLISLTASYNIAWDYAVHGGAAPPTRRNPAYVYEILLDPMPRAITLLEPVVEIVDHYRHLIGSMPYRHDGSQKFPIGIACDSVLPAMARRLLALSYRQPPPAGGAPRPPNLPIELEALVRSLRDSEILVLGMIPTNCVINRIDAYP